MLPDVARLGGGQTDSRGIRDLLERHKGTESIPHNISPSRHLAPSGSHYTRRVIGLVARWVVEDGLPHRVSGWHLWRDHPVFVGTVLRMSHPVFRSRGRRSVGR
jgi:hypothetical protein